MPNAMACFIAQRRELVTTARLTVSTFSSFQTVHAPPGGFFFVPEPVEVRDLQQNCFPAGNLTMMTHIKVHKETSLSQSNRVTSLKKNLHDESEH
jgi:hypothetical protein